MGGRPALVLALGVAGLCVTLCLAAGTGASPDAAPDVWADARVRSVPTPHAPPNHQEVGGGESQVDPASGDPQSVRTDIKSMTLEDELAEVSRLERDGLHQELLALATKRLDARIRIAALRALATHLGEEAREPICRLILDRSETSKVRAAAAR